MNADAPPTMPPAGPPPRPARARELMLVGQVAAVRPGDRLVIAFADRLDMAELDRMRRMIRESLPGVDAIVFDGATGLAVYKP